MYGVVYIIQHGILTDGRTRAGHTCIRSNIDEYLSKRTGEGGWILGTTSAGENPVYADGASKQRSVGEGDADVKSDLTDIAFDGSRLSQSPHERQGKLFVTDMHVYNRQLHGNTGGNCGKTSGTGTKLSVIP